MTQDDQLPWRRPPAQSSCRQCRPFQMQERVRTASSKAFRLSKSDKIGPLDTQHARHLSMVKCMSRPSQSCPAPHPESAPFFRSYGLPGPLAASNLSIHRCALLIRRYSIGDDKSALKVFTAHGQSFCKYAGTFQNKTSNTTLQIIG